MFVGFLLSLNLLIPMLANRIDNSSYPWQGYETEQNTPVIKKDEYAPDPSITEVGGTAPVIQNTANPVPEIAAYWAESMVGINGYTTEEGVETLYARGSGFVIREDGYILTNFHVIAESASYTVDIEGKGECPAQFVGGDATMDIASCDWKLGGHQGGGARHRDGQPGRGGYRPIRQRDGGLCELCRAQDDL